VATYTVRADNDIATMARHYGKSAGQP